MTTGCRSSPSYLVSQVEQSSNASQLHGTPDSNKTLPDFYPECNPFVLGDVGRVWRMLCGSGRWKGEATVRIAVVVDQIRLHSGYMNPGKQKAQSRGLG